MSISIAITQTKFEHLLLFLANIYLLSNTFEL